MVEQREELVPVPLAQAQVYLTAHQGGMNHNQWGRGCESRNTSSNSVSGAAMTKAHMLHGDRANRCWSRNHAWTGAGKPHVWTDVARWFHSFGDARRASPLKVA